MSFFYCSCFPVTASFCHVFVNCLFRYRPTAILEKELQDSGLLNLLDMLPSVASSLTDSSKASISGSKSKKDRTSTKQSGRPAGKRAWRRAGSGRSKRSAPSAPHVIAAGGVGEEGKRSVNSSAGKSAVAMIFVMGVKVEVSFIGCGI